MKSHGALLSFSKWYISPGRTKITEFQFAKLYLNEIISKLICELRVLFPEAGKSNMNSEIGER